MHGTGLVKTDFANGPVLDRMKGVQMHKLVPAPPVVCAVLACTLTLPQMASAEGKSLTGVIGLGASYGPEFPGSDESSSSAFPIFNLTWRDRVFLNQRGLGVYALRNYGAGDLSLGFAVGYDFDERLAEDDVRLTGLRDVEAGALFTAFIEYDLGIADLEFDISHGLSDGGHEGTRATLATEFSTAVSPRLSLSAKPFVTWADSSYNQAFYGVSAAEAGASSFARYEAGSGLERAGIQLQASYTLSERTGVFLGVSHAELMGDAKDSPIVFDSGQTQISSGIFFRF
ncbi:putative protein MipA [Phaeobacter inhibens]|uniref:Uncharacterized protein n=2 Tax=Phaeobacter inhibens TaxID=221822 RepID=A0A2I7KBC7_9RHOB|nr:putative protein MipA [Phaeobacter inhibens]